MELNGGTAHSARFFTDKLCGYVAKKMPRRAKTPLFPGRAAEKLDSRAPAA
jgi:hypothetical protein